MKQHLITLLLAFGIVSVLCAQAQTDTNWADICRIKSQNRTQFSNGGWNYDVPQIQSENKYK